MSKRILLLLLVVLIISGCSAGRGDWRIELCSGYAIDHVNSREIVLVHKENSQQAGSSLVIPNYFILAYWLNDNYIVLEGIPSKDLTITEKEIKDRKIAYYIVDIKTGDVSLPFNEWTTLEEYCTTIDVDISEKWVTLSVVSNGSLDSSETDPTDPK